MAKRSKPRPQLDMQPSAEEESSQIAFSNLSLHELFEQQAADMLARADLDEEQKQGMLVALNCPCCGAGGMSFTVKLRREG